MPGRPLELALDWFAGQRCSSHESDPLPLICRAGFVRRDHWCGSFARTRQHNRCPSPGSVRTASSSRGRTCRRPLRLLPTFTRIQTPTDPSVPAHHSAPCRHTTSVWPAPQHARLVDLYLHYFTPHSFPTLATAGTALQSGNSLKLRGCLPTSSVGTEDYEMAPEGSQTAMCGQSKGNGKRSVVDAKAVTEAAEHTRPHIDQIRLARVIAELIR